MATLDQDWRDAKPTDPPEDLKIKAAQLDFSDEEAGEIEAPPPGVGSRIFGALQSVKEKVIDPITEPFTEAYLGVAGFDPADRLTGGLPGHETEKELFKQAPATAATWPIGLGRGALRVAELAKTPVLRGLLKVTATGLTGAGEAAVGQAAANVLTPDTKLDAGTAFAGGIGGIAGTVAGALGVARKLGPVTDRTIQPLLQELRSVSVPTAPAKPFTKAPTQTPSVAEVFIDEAGTAKGRFYNVGVDGVVTHRELPLGTATERAKWAKELNKTPAIAVQTAGDVGPALQRWNMQDMDLVFRGLDEPPMHGPKPRAEGTFTTDAEVRRREADWRAMAEREARMDAPPAGPVSGAEVGVDATGRLELTNSMRAPRTGAARDAQQTAALSVGGPLRPGGVQAVLSGDVGGGPPVTPGDLPPLPPPPPMPAAPPPPGGGPPVFGPAPRPLSPAELQLADETTRLVTTLQKAPSKGLLRTILGGVLADHLRGPQEANQIIAAMQGAHALGDPRLNLEAVRRAMPGRRLFDAASSDLSRVGEGRMSMADFTRKHPEIAADAQKTFNNMIGDIRHTSAKLEAMGFVPEGLEELRDAGLMDQYLHRMYAAHFLGRGQWKRIAPEEVVDRGVKYLVQQNPKRSSSEVAATVMDALGAEDPTEALRASGLLGSAGGLLKGRQSLAPAIRELLGEISSGPIRIAYTHAKQQSLLHQAYIWRELVQSPWMSDVMSPTHTFQVPNNPKMYGPAAGKFLHQDMEPLLHMPKAHAHSQGLMDALGISPTAFIKANQVLFNPRSWVNNAVRNLKGSVLAGGLEPWRPVRFGRDMKAAVDVLRAFRKDPSSRGAGALAFEAKAMGALPSGYGRIEGVGQEADKVFDELARSLGTHANAYDGLGQLRRHLDKLNIPRNKLAPYYDAIDATFKMANYLAVRRKAIRKGMPIKEAARLAAYRVNQSFANFEHVGKWVDSARRSPYGAVAPYLTSQLEDVRVNAMLPGRFVREPDLMARVAASGAILGGAVYALGALRRLRGISDQDVAEAQAVTAKATKVFRPGEIALPERDSKGRLQFVDLGTWAPELQLLQGHSEDPAFNRIAYNLATQLTGMQGSFAEPMVREFSDRAGLTTRIPSPDYTPPFGEDGTLKAVADYLKAGAIPAVAHNAMTTAPRVFQPTSPGQEPLTMGQGAANMVFPPTRPVTLPSEDPLSPTYRRSQGEALGRLKALQDDARQIARNPRLSPEEKKARIRGIANEAKRLGLEQRSIRQIVNTNKETKR